MGAMLKVSKLSISVLSLPTHLFNIVFLVLPSSQSTCSIMRREFSFWASCANPLWKVDRQVQGYLKTRKAGNPDT